MSVDQAGAALSFRFLDTGYGPQKDPLGRNTKNGIAYVSAADLDGDHISDYVYAGDRFGNLWRFDLTSSDPAKWTADAKPIFSTPAGRPITTRVTVTIATQPNGAPRVLLGFGTGQLYPQTSIAQATYAPGQQALYGIWDWNMAAWNALGSVQYMALRAPQSITAANLLVQTATTVPVPGSNTATVRTVTSLPICWFDGSSTTCKHMGWTLPMPVVGEQIIYSPVTQSGVLVVNTTIPANVTPLSCNVPPPTGFTMAISYVNGGAPATSFFPGAGQNVNTGGQVIGGIGLGAIGTPIFVMAQNKPFMFNQTVGGGSGGVGNVNAIAPTSVGVGTRVNWIELR